MEDCIFSSKLDEMKNCLIVDFHSSQSFLKDHSEQRSTKSEGDSRRFRDVGNKHYLVVFSSETLDYSKIPMFQAGRDIEAITAFNKAILKAPFNDEKKGKDFSLAVANRSAVLLRLGYHQAALEDVDLALEAGYPKDLKYKLLDRKLCLLKILKKVDKLNDIRNEFIEGVNASSLPEEKKVKMINEIDKDKSVLKEESRELEINILSQELDSSHPDLPSMTSFADVKYEDSRGRFVVANR